MRRHQRRHTHPMNVRALTKFGQSARITSSHLSPTNGDAVFDSVFLFDSLLAFLLSPAFAIALAILPNNGHTEGTGKRCQNMALRQKIFQVATLCRLVTHTRAHSHAHSRARHSLWPTNTYAHRMRIISLYMLRYTYAHARLRDLPI